MDIAMQITQLQDAESLKDLRQTRRDQFIFHQLNLEDICRTPFAESGEAESEPDDLVHREITVDGEDPLPMGDLLGFQLVLQLKSLCGMLGAQPVNDVLGNAHWRRRSSHLE